jgi:hypothetical protein
MNKIFKIAAFAVVALALVAGASSADAAFSRYLTVGSTGADVSELQAILVSNGYLASGLPSGYFGALTKAAVMKWQAAVGLPATGFFGPMSIAKIGAGSTSTGSTGSTSSNSGSTSDLKGGDGDFKDFKINGSPNNKTVNEGESQDVLGFEFKADNSDLLVSRVDVIASSTNGNDLKRPWKVIDSVELLANGKKVASVDASNSKNWDEQDTDQYRLRFEGINYKVNDGDKVKFTVAVTAKDSIDSNDTGDFKIWLDNEGIRARNAEGIDVYESGDNSGDKKTFSIDTADTGSFTVTTENVALYTAKLKAKNSDNNINSVTVSLATTSASVGGLDDMVDTLYLFIDGEEVGSESVSAGATDDVTFDDLDVDIKKDDKVDFEVKADINEQGNNEENYDNGDGVMVTGVSIDFTDSAEDDHTTSDSQDGGAITFNLNALKVDLVGSPEASYSSTAETSGDYTVSFKVTAPDNDDIYIPATASRTSTTTAGVGFTVYDSSNAYVGTATTTLAELVKTGGSASLNSNYYKISSGNTATFKMHVVLDNYLAPANNARKVGLTQVNYKAGSAATPDTTYTSGLDDDFRTSSLTLYSAKQN